MEKIDLKCPYCEGQLIPMMIHNSSYRNDEFDGMECVECWADWEKSGKAMNPPSDHPLLGAANKESR
jgi:hypothetical protein